MMRGRWTLLLGTAALAGCGYANFRGAIAISRDQRNLRVVGGFSPDGSQFASGEARLTLGRTETGVVKVWRRGPTPDLPHTWRLVSQIELTDLFIVDLAFSPDGRVLAVAGLGREKNILLWDLPGRRVAGVLRGAGPLVQAIAFGPSGKWLVSAGIDGQIEVWDLATGKRRARVDDDASLLRQSRFPLAVARDGSWVAYGRTDGRVAFADPTTGIRLDVRSTGGLQIYDLSPSPDGRWLAVATDTGVRLWDLGRPGSTPRLLSPEPAPALAFFPDSRTLLACGRLPRNSKVLEVSSGRVVYGFVKGSSHVGNEPLPSPGSTSVVGPREERIWRRLHRTFPLQGEEEAVRSLVLGYVRFPSMHRVAVSPENLWVAFFEGGQASLVITQDHYQLRVSRKAPPPPPPRDAKPRRLEESL